MPTTWEDVTVALDEAEASIKREDKLSHTGMATLDLFHAVSALAELLAPPADMDERITEAVAADAGWVVDRWSKQVGYIRFTVDVYRDASAWCGSWLYIYDSGKRVRSVYFDADTGDVAKAAAVAWLAEHEVQS